MTMSKLLNILIVDDNQSIVRTMSQVLNRLGHSVKTANSGAEAIAIAKQNHDIDIIFMDIRMPSMNGVEALKEIKPIIPNVVVIMMTAYSVEDRIRESFEEGAGGVLHKPVDFTKVLELINNVNNLQQQGLILVVDDDTSFLESSRRVLERQGFTVLTTDSGGNAIQIARKEDCDIVLMDMNMPDMNGLQTFLKMREDDPESIIILITGFYSRLSEEVASALFHSAYACLEKPLDLEKLFSMMRDIFSRRRVE